MKILMLQPYPCTRNFKQSASLRKLGHEVDLAFLYGGQQVMKTEGGRYWLTYDFGLRDVTGFFAEDAEAAEAGVANANVEKYGEFYDQIINMYRQGPIQITDLIEEYGYDIIHSHNTPDHGTVMALAASRLTGVPVIHDAHDVYQIYRPGCEMGHEHRRVLDEMLCLYADGHLFTSKNQLELVQARYKYELPNAAVLHCYTTEQQLATPEQLLKKSRPWPEDEIHVVYEGGLVFQADNDRNLLPVWERLMAAGIHVHFYPAAPMPGWEQQQKKYNGLLHYEGSVAHNEIIETLAATDYDAGLLLPYLDHAGADTDIYAGSMPNKLFEYLGAGIPAWCDPRMENAAAWVQQRDVGIIGGAEAAKANGFKRALRQAKSMVPKLDRKEMTYEGHMDVVLGVYEKAIKARKANEGEISTADVPGGPALARVS